MSIRDDSVLVVLNGWDRILNWRRAIEFKSDTITAVRLADRAALELLIDHRAFGWGTHDGSKRPGHRRVGTMLGRGVPGKQFWAVGAGSSTTQLVVLDLQHHEFARAVLEVHDPESFQDAAQRL
ncbi:MAG: hypothetical protein H6512_15630 [Acidimicrobiia bacterium]|nr:hypothetical protein [Acidimicrobiia bacterium]